MILWPAFAICLMAWAVVALSPTAVSASAWPPPTPPYFSTEEEFNKLLPYREDDHCSPHGFYTYSAFVTAARAFPNLQRSDIVTRKREIAAFLAQTAAETTENYKLIQAGAGETRHSTQECTLAYETGIWFWMTPHSSEVPSCHDVIVGNWKPSAQDVAAGPLPGYGVISNIWASTNGKKQECGFGWNNLQASRIHYYIDGSVQRSTAAVAAPFFHRHSDVTQRCPFSASNEWKELCCCYC